MIKQRYPNLSVESTKKKLPGSESELSTTNEKLPSATSQVDELKQRVAEYEAKEDDWSAHMSKQANDCKRRTFS